MPTKLRNGQTILFIGDSITDCGRRGANGPLGDGYVKLFEELLILREPQKKVKIINKGIGGNRVTDLQNRWTDDVLRHRPNWLSVKIGINDLHSALMKDPAAVTPDLFEKAYDDILSRTRAALPNVRLLLIDPFFISRDRSESSFRRKVLDWMPRYLRVVEKMSRKHRARRIKIHEKFQKLMQYVEADRLAPEPVHPYRIGHLLIAEEIYRALSS